VVGADDVTEPKPHPEPVQRALQALGATPEEAVFVGDSVHDMASGRAAGVATAAVLWGPFTRGDLDPANPDHWLEDPVDLLPLLVG
jgi:pyrophosphatase PpaX